MSLARRLILPLVGVSAVITMSVPAVPALAQGQELFLTSALAVDTSSGTVTLPLHRGTSAGRTVWYVITESSDRDDAERRGVNFSERMSNALGTRAVQTAAIGRAGIVDFPGTVDFAPTRVVVPGPTGFPPAIAIPGAVGDARYSPLVTTDGRVVLNATQVANSSGLHDAIVNFDPLHGRVTMDTFDGFIDGKAVQYLHQEASVPDIAAIEGSTFAPNLNAAPGFLDNEAPNSAREEIIPIVNGPLGRHNPQRQGLQSALLGQGDPLNIPSADPNDEGYSPIWDIHPAVWTDQAIAAGLRHRLTSEDEVADLFAQGQLVSGGTGPPNSDLNGLRSMPGISMCPIVLQLG